MTLFTLCPECNGDGVVVRDYIPSTCPGCAGKKSVEESAEVTRYRSQVSNTLESKNQQHIENHRNGF